MSRVEENTEFREGALELMKQVNGDANVIYQPVMMTAIMDISASLAVIADKLGGNNGYCEDGIELLTDKEQRIFLKAMSREREVCQKVDDEYSDDSKVSEVSLVEACDSIKRKVKKIWE